MSSSDRSPAKGFAGFDLGPSVQRGIAAAGFIDPRPIQARTIPAALQGRDILGLAQTGTGKTAAFALPLIERLLARRGAGPRVLILAPTRELASQIAEDFRSLARFTRLQVATVFGGVPARSQITALRAGPEIVVACPGRLLDLHQQGALRLDRIEALVLDEADHMFDMGFLPDVRRILAALPAKRQNLLFSATMPGEIRKLADRLLRKPEVVELGHSAPVETVDHALFPVAGAQRLHLLERVLAEDDFGSAIVFTRTKHRAKRLARQLAQAGHRAVALQGNMSQGQRDRAMAGFRQREFDILVATDIAARGIDVEKISHVVNFDVPNTPDAYTHRIGRTGRSEREGKAYTFVAPEDDELVRAVERRIGARIRRESVTDLPDVPSRAGRLDDERRSRSATRSNGRARSAAPSRSGRRTRSTSAKPRPKRDPLAAIEPAATSGVMRGDGVLVGTSRRRLMRPPKRRGL